VLERQLAEIIEANRRLAEERARVQTEAQVVRSRQEELTSIQHRRARSRLHGEVVVNPTVYSTRLMVQAQEPG